MPPCCNPDRESTLNRHLGDSTEHQLGECTVLCTSKLKEFSSVEGRVRRDNNEGLRGKRKAGGRQVVYDQFISGPDGSLIFTQP